MSKITRIQKIVFQIAVLLGLILLLSSTVNLFASFFASYIFTPLQVLRCGFFRYLPISAGDVLYLFAILYCLYVLLRFLRTYQGLSKNEGWAYLLRSIRTLLLLYLVLILTWGINYARPKLVDELQLPSTASVSDAEMIAFDSLLICRLNALETDYEELSYSKMRTLAKASYAAAKAPMTVFVKRSLLGNALAYFGVEGYFNPFTGEAQVNKHNPYFIQPFVICHEMAHQTGIAAEDDANLLAYIRCVESNDPTFQYAAYFNVWLYAHRKVRSIDSARADALKQMLNSTTLEQLTILKNRSKQYHTILDNMSSYIFDVYLKMEHQDAGIGSYRNVAFSAYCWEREKAKLK